MLTHTQGLNATYFRDMQFSNIAHNAIEFNTAGDLFIADYDGHSIRKVTGLGAPFTLPPTGASTDGLVWLAAALLGAGVLLVTTRRRHTV